MGFLTFLFLTALSFQFTPLATEISHKEFKTVLAHFEYLLEIYWNNFFHPTVFSCNMACSYLSHQILISSKKTGDEITTLGEQLEGGFWMECTNIWGWHHSHFGMWQGPDNSVLRKWVLDVIALWC